MDKNIKDFIFSSFKEVFNFVDPFLSNFDQFSRNLSKQKQIKPGDNIQYQFDIEIDKLIKKNIEEYQLTGKIFSEESGFYQFGPSKYRIVFDPFCNSSLAARTFYQAAVGLSIFTNDYQLISSAIMDYQSGITALVEDGKTNFYQIQNKNPLHFNFGKSHELKNAWVVFTLETNQERGNIAQAEKLLTKPKRVILSSGHIYWLKLATGAVDAYLDPFGGEPMYEMFAATAAQHSGSLVTDQQGNKFDPTKQLQQFEHNPQKMYYPVGATSQKLHQQILNLLNNNG
jgi:fructose-1,6-bisphosphatase/inositol monophosphatase family enzyme